ncbi:hypothetical protein [Teichococcus oryzae]|uniref:Secreted protein n=1 Tax=Teichococcus oryzae TaxID=1608942 RepID=A0A5B2TLI5_9PROT|nr:hypothetical protein [Pseudoroseomonas oryzae]KAA2214798.1 hypothetical protein F0Q34_03675 [Pseudoroseomonas oryzae]
MRRLRQLAMIGLAATGLVLGTAAALPTETKAGEVVQVHDGWRRGPPPGWRHHRHPPPRHYYRPPPRVYYAPPPRYYRPPPPRYYRPPPPPHYYYRY